MTAKGLRYAAMRKAQEAKQRRDAERLVRERKVELALAEFFEHAATVEQIEQDTAARLAKVAAAGAVKAAAARELVAVALRAMLELGETRTAVAELTGLSLPAIRDALTTTADVATADVTASGAIDEVTATDFGGGNGSSADAGGDQAPVTGGRLRAQPRDDDIGGGRTDVYAGAASGWDGGGDWFR